ncbi:unnamed protein product, partial [Ectocarpus sp. 12 AP-2014]
MRFQRSAPCTGPASRSSVLATFRSMVSTKKRSPKPNRVKTPRPTGHPPRKITAGTTPRGVSGSH